MKASHAGHRGQLKPLKKRLTPDQQARRYNRIQRRKERREATNVS